MSLTEQRLREEQKFHRMAVILIADGLHHVRYLALVRWSDLIKELLTLWTIPFVLSAVEGMLWLATMLTATRQTKSTTWGLTERVLACILVRSWNAQSI